MHPRTRTAPCTGCDVRATQTHRFGTLRVLLRKPPHKVLHCSVDDSMQAHTTYNPPHPLGGRLAPLQPPSGPLPSPSPLPIPFPLPSPLPSTPPSSHFCSLRFCPALPYWVVAARGRMQWPDANAPIHTNSRATVMGAPGREPSVAFRFGCYGPAAVAMAARRAVTPSKRSHRSPRRLPHCRHLHSRHPPRRRPPHRHPPRRLSPRRLPHCRYLHSRHPPRRSPRPTCEAARQWARGAVGLRHPA